jgi:predicted amidohydrolase YtcJ
MKLIRKTFTLVLPLTLLLAACDSQRQQSAAEPPEVAAPAADFVFLNGGVYTVNPERAWVEAAAVLDGEITYTGRNENARNLIGEKTRIIDLEGKMLIPGFHDSHIHLVSGGQVLRSCNLAEIYTNPEILEKLGTCRSLDGLGDEGWITGGVWDREAFDSVPPDRYLLDEYFPDRPAFLGASDGHSGWANSRALELAGIDKTTPDPPNGQIERDPVTGEPTGIFNESAMALVESIIPPLTLEENVAGVRLAIDEAHSFGITSMLESGLDETLLEPLDELNRNGQFDVRMLASISPIAWTVSAMDDGIFAMLEARQGKDGGNLNTDSVKFFLDGVLETGTALLVDPYTLPESDFSEPIYEQAVLNGYFTRLDDAGIQVHVHAIGDGAVRSALDAFEAARKANGPRDNRHHIVHLQLIHPEDIPRFAELNVSANFQALWAWPDYWIMDLNLPMVGRDRVDRMYPIGSVHRSGGRIVGGSDWTVSSLNPLDAIEVAVRRQDQESDTSGVLNESERVDLETMLAAYTVNGAWLMKQEHKVGTIETGKRADLVVLDRNLFEIPATEINEARVQLTFFDGEIVYEAEHPGSHP